MTHPNSHLGDGAPEPAGHLRLVTPTVAPDLSEITVNRDPNGVDPFAPVVFTPTFSEHSRTPSGFAVELGDPAEPTGYRHVGAVGPNYLVLPNLDVRNLALDIASRTNLPFRESALFWDGKRMMHTVDLLGHTEAVVPGDDHGLRLVTMTSYDRSWKYRCMLGVVRFQCSNGTVVSDGDWLASVDFRHVAAPGSPKAESWRAVVRQAMDVVDAGPEALDRFVGAMRVLRSMRTTDGRLREVWGALSSLPDGVKGRILTEYVDHEPEGNLYSLYNAGTATLSRRGEKATAADVGHLDTFCSAMLGVVERLT